MLFEHLKDPFNAELIPFKQDDIYSPINNKILGKFKITQSRDSQLVSISCGLRGQLKLKYYYNARHERGMNRMRNPRYANNNETKVIEDLHTIMDDNKFLTINNLELNTPLLANFELNFPSEGPDLPSSCFELGLKHFGGANVSITYDVYITFRYISTLLHMEKQSTFCFPVNYQGKSYSTLIQNPRDSGYSTTILFPHKLKKFYFDHELSALVPNDMKNSHIHTRLIRGLFNDSYKAKNYNERTQDVKITGHIVVNDKFAIDRPFVNILGVLNLSYEGDIDKNFVFNNQTTGLGVFEIKKVSIVAKRLLFYKVDIFDSKCELPCTLATLNFENNEKRVDFKDAKYDKEKDAWLMSLDFMNELFDNKSLLDLENNKVIFCDYQFGEFFRCNTNIQIEIELSDGNYEKPMKRSLIIFLNSTPDLTLYGDGIKNEASVNVPGAGSYENETNPPPMYTEKD